MTVTAVEEQMQDDGMAGRTGRRRPRRRWRIIGWICLWAMFAMTAVIAGKASAAGASLPAPSCGIVPTMR